MHINHVRAYRIAAVLMLAFASTTLPALADFGFSVRIAVLAAPPTPPPSADRDYPEPCGDKKLQWFVYGAQIFNAFVVSNAVNQGSKGVTIFGTSKTAPPYLGEMAFEDVAARLVTRNWSCRQRNIVQGLIGGSALINAGYTGFPHQ